MALRALMLLIFSTSAMACSTTGTCKGSHAEVAPRKPASVCEILYPFKMRVKGRTGGYSYEKNEAWNAELIKKGYSPIQPTMTEHGLPGYLANIKNGSYGLVIVAGISLTQNGWGEMLLFKKTGDSLETFALKVPKGGWDDHITEAMSGLPACTAEAQ